jgi:biopolymer transport protein ExbD
MKNSASDQLTAIPQKRAKIQLISFVAVVFLLMATFALFSMGLEKKSNIPQDLPYGCSCGGWGRGELPVVLQVTDAGLYWNKTLITERELPDVLAKYKAKCQNPRIVLSSDDRAKYGQTIVTLDEIRKAGISQVTIETTHRATGM